MGRGGRILLWVGTKLFDRHAGQAEGSVCSARIGALHRSVETNITEKNNVRGLSDSKNGL